jgi:hypothetical protein
MIISYLVEELGQSVELAIANFVQARPTGIYKSEDAAASHCTGRNISLC